MRKINLASSSFNFISNLCAFLITYSISFFLSPYIVGTLGSDAYGFVSLATSFTNYISLATVALNSLASRFVSVEIFRGNEEKAQKYYTSVMVSNVVLTAILVIPCAVFVAFLERFISIPAGLVTDVKVLFSLIFASFFVSLLSSLFSLATFVQNRLYLNALHNAVSAVLRLVLTVLLFAIFPANIAFCGIVTLVTNLYVIFWRKRYMNKYLPQFRIRLEFFDFKKVTELLKAGSWSLVSQISGLLNTGFDLLLANQFISSVAMGVLSISSTLPSIIQSVLGSVSSAFTPNLTKYYANKQFDEMTAELKRSIKMMSVVLIVPMAGLTIFGGSFYALWQPTQNATQLQILSVLKILCLIFTGSLAVVHEIFTVANKIKPQAIATLISGIANIVIVYILLRTTNWGIYAIAGVSSVIAIARNYLFTFLYAAKCVHQKWYTFYLLSLRTFGSYLLVCALFYGVKRFICAPDDWVSLIIVCFLCAILGVLLNLYLMVSKEERKLFLNKVFGRFKKE